MERPKQEPTRPEIKSWLEMKAKEENVKSLCMVVGRRISSTWLSRFPSPPGLIRMFKTREGKVANTILLKVRSIPDPKAREICSRFTEEKPCEEIRGNRM
jgi:hypothetical protein